jgi:hypothetical protein
MFMEIAAVILLGAILFGAVVLAGIFEEPC